MEENMKKKYALLSVLLLLMVIILPVLAACDNDSGTTDSQGRTKIKFWYWGSLAEKKVYEELMDRYMEENENVIIVPTHYESSIYMTNFQGENPKPDVFFMPDTDFLSWADAGIMEGLLPYCTQEELNSVWPKAMDEYYYDVETHTLGKSANAKLYGFPKDLGPVTLVYNETLLDKQIAANGLNKQDVYKLLDPRTPMTWAQFTQLLVDLTKDQKGLSKADRIYGIPYYEMDACLYSNNANYFYENATKQGIDNNFIQAVAFNIQLATVYDVMPDADFSGSTDAYTRFLSNKSIFTWMGPWDNADFWDYKSLKYNIVPVPYGPAEGAQSVSFVGSMCYGVSAKSKVKQEAVKFAKWLSMSKSCQQLSVSLGQQLPNLIEMVNDYVSADWDVQPANRSVFIDIIDDHTDSLGLYAASGKQDMVSGKTRALYYTYDSTWRTNLLNYLNTSEAWKMKSTEDITNLLINYRSQLQSDLDNMNKRFKN